VRFCVRERQDRQRQDYETSWYLVLYGNKEIEPVHAKPPRRVRARTEARPHSHRVKGACFLSFEAKEASPALHNLVLTVLHVPSLIDSGMGLDVSGLDCLMYGNSRSKGGLTRPSCRPSWRSCSRPSSRTSARGSCIQGLRFEGLN